MKKKTFILRLLLYCVGTILLISCNTKEPEKNNSLRTESTISLRASQAFRRILSGSLRAGDPAIVIDIDSAATDTVGITLYIANFQNGGFLLFRENKNKLMDILGFSEESSLHYVDTIQNLLLKEYVIKPALMGNIVWNPDWGRHGSDGTFIPVPFPDPRFEKDYPYYDFFSQVDSVRYLRKPETFMYFDQEHPFNEMINHKGRTWPIGCGGIAVATVLSYYEKQCYNREPFQVDWKKLKEKYQRWGGTSDPQVYCVQNMSILDPRLLRNTQLMMLDIWLSTKSMVGTHKGSDYTLATSGAIMNCLKKYGIQSYKADFQKNFLWTNFTVGDKSPLIIRGWDHATSAHYWVIDGAAQQYVSEYKIKYETPEDKTGTTELYDRRTKIFYHCTWGWGGSRNGWYSSDLFFADLNKNDSDIDDNPNLRVAGTPNEDYNFKATRIYKTWK